MFICQRGRWLLGTDYLSRPSEKSVFGVDCCLWICNASTIKLKGSLQVAWSEFKLSFTLGSHFVSLSHLVFWYTSTYVCVYTFFLCIYLYLYLCYLNCNYTFLQLFFLFMLRGNFLKKIFLEVLVIGLTAYYRSSKQFTDLLKVLHTLKKIVWYC